MEQSEKILIVDDEPINLEFFEVMLSKLGFRVDTAVDGEEALEKVLEIAPDLIILDNIMPGMTGWEVTRTLKQDPSYETVRDVPVIMFSAMDDVQDKIEGFELGVEDYITKPFNFSEVLARIKAVLRHREMSNEVVMRERRLHLLEALNKSLLQTVDSVRSQLQKVQQTVQSRATDASSPDSAFAGKLSEEISSSIERLVDVKHRTDDLLSEGDSIRDKESSVAAVERKYRERFETSNVSPTEADGTDT